MLPTNYMPAPILSYKLLFPLKLHQPGVKENKILDYYFKIKRMCFFGCLFHILKNHSFFHKSWKKKINCFSFSSHVILSRFSVIRFKQTEMKSKEHPCFFHISYQYQIIDDLKVTCLI